MSKEALPDLLKESAFSQKTPGTHQRSAAKHRKTQKHTNTEKSTQNKHENTQKHRKPQKKHTHTHTPKKTSKHKNTKQTHKHTHTHKKKKTRQLKACQTRSSNIAVSSGSCSRDFTRSCVRGRLPFPWLEFGPQRKMLPVLFLFWPGWWKTKGSPQKSQKKASNGLKRGTNLWGSLVSFILGPGGLELLKTHVVIRIRLRSTARFLRVASWVPEKGSPQNQGSPLTWVRATGRGIPDAFRVESCPQNKPGNTSCSFFGAMTRNGNPNQGNPEVDRWIRFGQVGLNFVWLQTKTGQELLVWLQVSLKKRHPT